MRIRNNRLPGSNAAIASGALLAAMGVGLDAIVAHILRDILKADALAAFQTATRYQLYHSLAIVAAGIAARVFGNGSEKGYLIAALLFGLGIVFFCGSLYMLALGGMKWLGWITPLGGLAFLGGWIMLFVAGASHRLSA